MSRDFDGVNDVITSGAGLTIGVDLTVACWFDMNTMGQTDAGRMYVHLAGTARTYLFWNNVAASNKLRFINGRTTTDGDWEMTTGFAAITGWKFFCVTYDGTSTSNNPTFYTLVGNTFSTLTVGSGITETTSPSGSQQADAGTLYIGNNETSTRTIDGGLGEFIIWPRELTAEEVQAVAFMGAAAVPDWLVYLPLDNGPATQDLSASAASYTVTGAVAAENPPTRPAGRAG